MIARRVYMYSRLFFIQANNKSFVCYYKILEAKDSFNVQLIVTIVYPGLDTNGGPVARGHQKRTSGRQHFRNEDFGGLIGPPKKDGCLPLGHQK